MSRRVVITGIGAVTPIGSGPDGLWDGVMAARSAVSEITHFDPSPFATHIAAEVRDFDPDAHFEKKQQKRLDRYSMFAMACARAAAKDAGVAWESLDKERTGCCIGSALGGVANAEREHAKYMEGGVRAVNPALAMLVFGGAGSSNIAIDLELKGPVSANSDSCASGPIAIGRAMRFIQRGDADVMLAGAAEAPLSPLCFGAFAIIRAMSTRNDEPEKACRPFDKDRDGFVMAEGSAMLLLEERERALTRGARIYAELTGFGISNDAYHMAAPRPDGSQAARSMRLALSDAGIEPEDVDYINAHGSGTPLNDSTETAAIKAILGERATNVPVSATKSMHAHALGATGAIEAAICCLAMQHNIAPPTINLEEPEEGLDLDYVPHSPRPHRMATILSNSFGFGGINAALVLRRHE